MALGEVCEVCKNRDKSAVIRPSDLVQCQKCWNKSRGLQNPDIVHISGDSYESGINHASVKTTSPIIGVPGTTSTPTTTRKQIRNERSPIVINCSNYEADANSEDSDTETYVSTHADCTVLAAD